MRITYALAALIGSISLGLPCFAQSWEIGPVNGAPVAANAAPTVTGTPAPLIPPGLAAYDLAALQGKAQNGNTTMPTNSGMTSLTNPALGNVPHNPIPNMNATQTALMSQMGSTTLRPTSTTVMSQFGYQQLYPTILDSFVQQAGGAAFEIYGDEGVWDIPPLFSFDVINDGISSPQVDPGGLSTGHGTGTAIGVGVTP